MSDIKAVARMQAQVLGRAVRITNERTFALSTHPLVLIPVQMAGESPSLYALGVGNGIDPVQIAFCEEPRNRDLNYDFLEEAVPYIAAAFDVWDQDPLVYPQIVTTSKAAQRLVISVFDRMTFSREDRATLRALGRRARHFEGCFERPDSSGLLDLTWALGQVYATGQDDHADQHLGAALEWHNSPDGLIHERVRAAETQSVSVSTSPDLDNEFIVPLSEELREARDAGDLARMDDICAEMRSHFAVEIERRYALVRRALGILSAIPESRMAATICQLDRDRYNRARDYFADPNHHVPRGLRSNARGITQFLEREHALDYMETLGMHTVSGLRSAARLSGQVLTGEVVFREEYHEGRSLVVEWMILSEQLVLPIRPGDELVLLDWGEPFGFEVVAIYANNGRFLVHAHGTAGKTKSGQPDLGDEIELGVPLGSEWKIRRSMGIAWDRLTSSLARPQVQGQNPNVHDLLSHAVARRAVP